MIFLGSERNPLRVCTSRLPHHSLMAGHGCCPSDSAGRESWQCSLSFAGISPEEYLRQSASVGSVCFSTFFINHSALLPPFIDTTVVFFQFKKNPVQTHLQAKSPSPKGDFQNSVDINLFIAGCQECPEIQGKGP